MKKGKVKWYNSDKGFGFIESIDSKRDIFVNYANLTNCSTLKEGDLVEFEIKDEKAKGLEAIKVKLIGYSNYIISIYKEDNTLYYERYFNEHDKTVRQAIIELADLIEIGYKIEITEDFDLPF